MAPGYFAANYFADNYWADDYWADYGVPSPGSPISIPIITAILDFFYQEDEE